MSAAPGFARSRVRLRTRSRVRLRVLVLLLVLLVPGTHAGLPVGQTAAAVAPGDPGEHDVLDTAARPAARAVHRPVAPPGHAPAAPSAPGAGAHRALPAPPYAPNPLRSVVLRC
ncbi:hypothetical protein ABZT03_00300 [Streptomyces sp. NPDC005574]|uniref:hypothetical protein n=1 Tax=Streptomyces sp. NPDC005574 TaxID=3156891 RepID=UPI0033B23E1A